LAALVGGARGRQRGLDRGLGAAFDPLGEPQALARRHMPVKAPAVPAASRPETSLQAAIERRAQTLQKKLEQSEFAALALRDPVNVRYLTGFSSSHCFLLFALGQKPRLFTDPRYIESAAEGLPGKVYETIEIPRKGDNKIAEAIAKLGKGAKAGFEPTIPYSLFALWSETAPEVAFQPAGPMIASLRRQKDAAEIETIARSQKITEDIFERALEIVAKAGPGALTERDLANAIRGMAFERGVDMAFETIVASGKVTSRPHYEPSPDAKIGRGPLLIDMGVKLGGYCSDMTRMAHLGKPTPKFQKTHDLVNEARAAAIEAIRPGATGGEVHQAALDVFIREKMDGKFLHGTGHGVGMEIHESPSVGQGSEDKLEEGEIVTVEPGLYLKNWGGIRIEDLIVVQKGGRRNLTSASHELRVL
jgi:Xaa-Pro aminopeptidase